MLTAIGAVLNFLAESSGPSRTGDVYGWCLVLLCKEMNAYANGQCVP